MNLIQFPVRLSTLGSTLDEVDFGGLPPAAKRRLEELKAKPSRENDGAFIIADATGRRIVKVSPSRNKKRGDPYDFSDPNGEAFARFIVEAINAASGKRP